MRSRVDHTFFAGAPVVVTIVSNECHLPSLNCALICLPSQRGDGCLRVPVSVGASDVGDARPALLVIDHVANSAIKKERQRASVLETTIPRELAPQNGKSSSISPLRDQTWRPSTSTESIPVSSLSINFCGGSYPVATRTVELFLSSGAMLNTTLVREVYLRIGSG